MLNSTQLWNQVARSITLHHVSAYASRQCSPSKPPRVVLADDNNVHGGKFLLENLSRFEAIHRGHSHIEQDNVRQVLSCLDHGISSVHSLASNLDISLGLEELAKTPADAFIVIHH